jgi:hypothetical protein
MAWVVGSRNVNGWMERGNMLTGSINPPNIMEGRKINCDQSTVDWEVVEITPISAAMDP